MPSAVRASKSDGPTRPGRVSRTSLADPHGGGALEDVAHNGGWVSPVAAGRDGDDRGLYVFEKAGPGRLIDGCVAAVLAFEAQAQLELPVTHEILVAWA